MSLPTAMRALRKSAPTPGYSLTEAIYYCDGDDGDGGDGDGGDGDSSDSGDDYEELQDLMEQSSVGAAA